MAIIPVKPNTVQHCISSMVWRTAHFSVTREIRDSHKWVDIRSPVLNTEKELIEKSHHLMQFSPLFFCLHCFHGMISPKNPEYIGSLVGSWLWLYDWPLCLSTRRDSLLLHCPPNTEHFHAQFTTSRIPKKAVFLLALNFISTTFFKDTHFPDGHQEKILYWHTCSKMVKVGSFWVYVS